MVWCRVYARFQALSKATGPWALFPALRKLAVPSLINVRCFVLARLTVAREGVPCENYCAGIVRKDSLHLFTEGRTR